MRITIKAEGQKDWVWWEWEWSGVGTVQLPCVQHRVDPESMFVDTHYTTRYRLVLMAYTIDRVDDEEVIAMKEGSGIL
jgi:hypothetical protein